MTKETSWAQWFVPLWRKSFAVLLLLTGLALTLVQGQHQPGPGGNPCWYGNFAACHVACMRNFGAGGRCQGVQCVCIPQPMYPGAAPPMGSVEGRMSEQPREVPCMSGHQRCQEFCIQNTGYGGRCHGRACKCSAFNRR